MGEPPPGSAAEEAERLVVSALAAISLATRGWLASRTEGHRVATGSGECCACPVCRALTVAADPSPELVERLATGAAEVATGVASVLRVLSDTFGPTDPDSTDSTDSTDSPDPDPDPDSTDPDSDSADPEAADPEEDVDRGFDPPEAAAPGVDGVPEAELADIPPQSAGRGAKSMRTPVHQVVPPADPTAPTSVDNGDTAS